MWVARIIQRYWIAYPHLVWLGEWGWIGNSYIRFELIATCTVFWDVTSCSLAGGGSSSVGMLVQPRTAEKTMLKHYGHTVHKLSQRRLTADWLVPWKSDFSRCTVRSSLTGCQVTSRPRDRFSRYSECLDIFRSALVCSKPKDAPAVRPWLCISTLHDS